MKSLCVGRVVGALWGLSLAALSCHAQDFKLDQTLSKKRFIQVGYTYVRPLDSSSEVKDETGPLIRYDEKSQPYLRDSTEPLAIQARQSLVFLDANIAQDYPAPGAAANVALGAPKGDRINASGGGTPVVTLGTFLDEALNWSVETYVLGAPIRGSVRGAGRIGGVGSDAVNLGEIATTDQLGPMLIGRYHFGDKDDRVRFSLGLAATYVLFFNARTTASLDRYVGGPSKLSLDPAFGVGPVGGVAYRFNDRWSLHGSIGRLKMRTQGRIATQTNPTLLAASSAVTQAAADVGPNTLNAVNILKQAGQIPTILQGIAVARTGDANNLGVYERSVKVRIDPMIYNLSVGYAF